jgi:V8-like Glu-specific endopeptidase
MEDHEAGNGDGNVALQAPVGDEHGTVASPGAELGSEPMIGTAGGEITDSPEIAATGERGARAEAPMLLDAYHASYSDRATRVAIRRGEVAPRTVIGPDQRVKITNTQQYPWRAIASLLITAQDGTRYIGTAWFVSPRLLLTAGHNVFMHDEGGWAKSIQVVPGRNGTNQPYGSVTIASFRSTIGWTRDKKSDYDYGALLLPAASPLGTTVGWFGYDARGDADLRGVTVNVAGYPADKGGTTMWWMADPITNVKPLSIGYQLDTGGGQSGAPAFMFLPDRGRIGVGVHTYGSSSGNTATRLTNAVLRNVNAWKAEVA